MRLSAHRPCADLVDRRQVSSVGALTSAAAILAHNHPSGSAEPSQADVFLTQTLKTALALALVDVDAFTTTCCVGNSACGSAARMRWSARGGAIPSVPSG
jgi:DNA repair protein RadC